MARSPGSGDSNLGDRQRLLKDYNKCNEGPNRRSQTVNAMVARHDMMYSWLGN